MSKKTNHKKGKCATYEDLKVKNLKVKNVCAKNFNAETTTINVIDIESAVINNADINNLDVKRFSINGEDLTCKLTAPSVLQEVQGLVLFGITGATGPAIPTNVDPLVYNCLIQNAIQSGVDLQQRVFEGRSFINQYLTNYPCAPICPPPPTDPVPLNIYATLTLPIFNRRFCGETGATGSTYNDFLNTAVNFNLQVAYLLEEAQSTDARLVSVLVQIGFVDPDGPIGCTGNSPNVVIEEVFIANKQFYPTLDVTYGENFANTIDIPFSMLTAAYSKSPVNSQGAIQMVIYKEEGLCIWNQKGDGFECLFDEGTAPTNPPAGKQQQAAPVCPRGQQLCGTQSGFPLCLLCGQCPTGSIVSPCNTG